jgi:DNA-directed RNA polymerase subunit RPC12/RpoP
MMAITHHQYVGRSDGWCRLCGEPIDAECHRAEEGRRHRFGLDHEPADQPDPTVSAAVDIHADEPITPLPKAKSSADYTEVEKRIAEGLDEEKDWVCADCGREYKEGHLCRYCGSVRVVLKSVVADLFGPDWRKAFE